MGCGGSKQSATAEAVARLEEKMQTRMLELEDKLLRTTAEREALRDQLERQQPAEGHTRPQDETFSRSSSDVSASESGGGVGDRERKATVGKTYTAGPCTYAAHNSTWQYWVPLVLLLSIHHTDC